jgi:hypothetical protein
MRSEYWQGCFETWFFTFSHSSSIEEKDKKEKKKKKKKGWNHRNQRCLG